MAEGTQMTEAIATVQSAASSMKTFSLQTQDQQSKQTFEKLAIILNKAVETLQERQQCVEQQEP